MVLYAVVHSRATVHDYSVHMYVRCCWFTAGANFHLSLMVGKDME